MTVQLRVGLWAIFFVLGGTLMLRKEVRNMTRQEWDDYMDAILVYKYEGRKDVSKMRRYRTKKVWHS